MAMKDSAVLSELEALWVARGRLTAAMKWIKEQTQAAAQEEAEEEEGRGWRKSGTSCKS